MGVMLSGSRSLKVLVSSEYSGSRGARVRREVITSIESISADGRALHPVIIWPSQHVDHYSHARDEAFTRRNILSGWSKSGLRPLNPEKTPQGVAQIRVYTGHNGPRPSSDELLVTPVTPITYESLCHLQSTIEEDVLGLDPRGKLPFQKMLSATEKALAERPLRQQRNQELFQRNSVTTICLFHLVYCFTVLVSGLT